MIGTGSCNSWRCSQRHRPCPSRAWSLGRQPGLHYELPCSFTPYHSSSLGTAHWSWVTLDRPVIAVVAVQRTRSSPSCLTFAVMSQSANRQASQLIVHRAVDQTGRHRVRKGSRRPLPRVRFPSESTTCSRCRHTVSADRVQELRVLTGVTSCRRCCTCRTERSPARHTVCPPRPGRPPARSMFTAAGPAARPSTAAADTTV
jgi:hypothetical protein